MTALRDLRDAIADRAGSVLRHHRRKLWWIHSGYALLLGAFVVAFAQKGFQHARLLAISVVSAWLLVVVFFRVFGSGAEREENARHKRSKLRFFVMSYVLKNLYQGMLFFLLPLYWRSSTFGAANFGFVVLLGVCAVVSTFDLVFDRFVLERRVFASVFHGLTLFASLNLVIPALLPNTRTLYTLVAAAVVTVIAFWTLHVPARALKEARNVVIVVASLLAGVGVVYAGNNAIPPVPMYLSAAAVGAQTLPDGRLAMEVKALHSSVIQQLLAVTDVAIPGGQGDSLHHVWRHDGREVHRSTHDIARGHGPRGTLRIESTLVGRDLPKDLTGSWTVEVQTEDGQLVGRTAFQVFD